MSGIEIAGVVLAILPLIISVVENYKATSGPWRRWKEYDAGVERFQADVFIHEAIFHNECHILISSATGWDPEVAEKRLEQEVHYGHPTLTGEKLNEDLNQYLGRDSKLIYTLMVSINEDLALIKRKSEGFHPALHEEEPACQHLGEIGKRDWFPRIRRKFDKLDFAFSERHFKEELHALHQRNQALSQAMQQLRRKKKPNVRRGHVRRVLEPLIMKPSIGMVRQAAVSFCEALTDACKVHHQHSVHFGLTPKFQETSVHFAVALQGPIASTGFKGEVISDIVRFSSKSTLIDEDRNKEFVRDDGALDPMIRPSFPGKRFFDIETENLRGQKRTKLKHSEGGRAYSPDHTGKALGQLTIQNNHVVPISSNAAHTAPLDSEQGNFCKIIRRCIGNPRDHEEKVDLGHLSTPPPAGAEHQLYASCGSYRCNELRSLGSMMRGKLEGPISILEVIGLAKQLTSAVLYYQGTPILPANWTRENIMFFGVEKNQQDEGCGPLKDAYVNFILNAKGQNNKSRAGVKRRFPNDCTSTLSQILHELGHQQTRSKDDGILAVERDIQCLSTGKCDTVIKQLGSRYMDVLWQCIDRFGEGIDFSKAACQVDFEREVVAVLEQIGSGLEEALHGPFGGEQPRYL